MVKNGGMPLITQNIAKNDEQMDRIGQKCLTRFTAGIWQRLRAPSIPSAVGQGE